MNRFKKFISITNILFIIAIIVIVTLACCKAKDDLFRKQREQAIFEYYEDVETLFYNREDKTVKLYLFKD